MFVLLQTWGGCDKEFCRVLFCAVLGRHNCPSWNPSHEPYIVCGGDAECSIRYEITGQFGRTGQFSPFGPFFHFLWDIMYLHPLHRWLGKKKCHENRSCAVNQCLTKLNWINVNFGCHIKSIFCHIIRSLLHKIVRFETYLPVCTFWGGRYVLQKGKHTYSQWNVPTGRCVSKQTILCNRPLIGTSLFFLSSFQCPSHLIPKKYQQQQQAAPATGRGRAGMNCIRIGLPGKLILSKRKSLLEVLFSWK